MKRMAGLFLILIIAAISISACGSISNGVASLRATPTPEVGGEELDDEARAMAFTQCMREQGIEMEDPKVDADGNVQISKPDDNESFSRDEFKEGYDVCGVQLEGTSFGRKREDFSEKIDQLVELAACLREGGYEVDEPTAETLDTWLIDFRVEYDWEDPDAQSVFDECGGMDFGKQGQGKGK